jgi:hypothetical protein
MRRRVDMRIRLSIIILLLTTAIAASVNAQIVPDQFTRSSWERSLLDSLGTATDSNTRQYFLGRLLPVVTTASANHLLTLLTDAETAPMSATLLGVLIEEKEDDELNEEVKIAVRELLEQISEMDDADTHQKQTISLLILLQKSGNRDIFPALRQLVGNETAGIAAAALESIAAAGGKDAEKIILSAVSDASWSNDATAPLSALLKLAGTMAADGDIRSMESICNRIIRRASHPESSHLRSAALVILTENGRGSTHRLLTGAMKSDDISYRRTALNLAEGLPGDDVTELWINELRHFDAIRQAEIIAMLGRRGDSDFSEVAADYLNSHEAAVRVAAAGAIALMDDEGMISRLLDYILAYETADDQNAGAIAVITLAGEHTMAEVSEKLKVAQGIPSATLTGIISWSRDSRYFWQIRELINSPDDGVAATALLALKNLAAEEHQEELLNMLPKAASKQEMQELQLALQASAIRSDNREMGTERIIKALSDENLKPLVIPVLARIGGAKAARAVHREFENGDAILREICFEALMLWTDIHSAEMLLEIAASGNKSYGGIAAEAYLRQIAQADIDSKERCILLSHIVPWLMNTDHKALLIDIAASMPSIEAMSLVTLFFDDNDLQWYAARTTACMATPAGRDNYCGKESGESVPLSEQGVTQILERALKVASETGDKDLVEHIRTLTKM